MAEITFDVWIGLEKENLTGLAAVDECRRLGIEEDMFLTTDPREYPIKVSEDFARKYFRYTQTEMYVTVKLKELEGRNVYVRPYEETGTSTEVAVKQVDGLTEEDLCRILETRETNGEPIQKVMRG